MAGTLAAHLAVSLLASPAPLDAQRPNTVFFDLQQYAMEGLRLRRRSNCVACGHKPA